MPRLATMALSAIEVKLLARIARKGNTARKMVRFWTVLMGLSVGIKNLRARSVLQGSLAQVQIRTRSLVNQVLTALEIKRFVNLVQLDSSVILSLQFQLYATQDSILQKEKQLALTAQQAQNARTCSHRKK